MRWICCLSLSCVLSAVVGCQPLMPKAVGLKHNAWQQLTYQRQDQVDIQWHGQGFSFLLYQQQHGQGLDLLALSLTGQQLFQIEYDGQRITVKQRIAQMRLLPFEFLVRDILLATYPNFAKQSDPAIQDQVNAKGEEIYIHKQLVLKIQHQENNISLENIQVPYQMTFLPIENTLQPD